MASEASMRASHAVAMNKDRDVDELCSVVQELARIVEALVMASA